MCENRRMIAQLQREKEALLKTNKEFEQRILQNTEVQTERMKEYAETLRANEEKEKNNSAAEEYKAFITELMMEREKLIMLEKELEKKRRKKRKK